MASLRVNKAFQQLLDEAGRPDRGKRQQRVCSSQATLGDAGAQPTPCYLRKAGYWLGQTCDEVIMDAVAGEFEGPSAGHRRR
ncbi:hypothetical protein [Streptomyces decoyicus]